MPDASAIERFVRRTLGCNCPEEVFRSIECRKNVRLNSFIELDARLVIGNRLLVYIANAGTPGCVEEHLPVLVASGKNERDEKGLNRFRLVLVADEPEKVRRTAERQFEGLRGQDEKLHLHVIQRRENIFNAKIAE